MEISQKSLSDIILSGVDSNKYIPMPNLIPNVKYYYYADNSALFSSSFYFTVLKDNTDHYEISLDDVNDIDVTIKLKKSFKLLKAYENGDIQYIGLVKKDENE